MRALSVLLSLGQGSSSRHSSGRIFSSQRKRTSRVETFPIFFASSKQTPIHFLYNTMFGCGNDYRNEAKSTHFDHAGSVDDGNGIETALYGFVFISKRVIVILERSIYAFLKSARSAQRYILRKLRLKP